MRNVLVSLARLFLAAARRFLLGLIGKNSAIHFPDSFLNVRLFQAENPKLKRTVDIM
jgi:hypothetical protein